MKTFTKIFFALLLGATLSHAAAFSKDAKFRTTTVHITADKPLTTGSNTVVVTIKKNGKLIDDAKVALKAFMPAMPGMPAMSSKANATKLENGKYKATLNFAMGGTWQLHIFITPKKGKKSRVKTTLNF
ncbi:FixH family protein [Sulfurimonas paralvinellae]|uniref:FixH family protein n=1 Tax=Sulfurimonas paralvinellae TaxID=317658 RepID=A0A7M1BA37_9BACT|nr:FixH family protein [Sulfurimonas paralvinellae]QOP46573.1 FixH family protein [Sulfurimonas paralvinellae]